MYPEKLDSFQLHKRVDILLQDYSPRKLSHGCQFQFSPLAIAGPRLFSKLRQEEVTVCNEAGGAWIDDTRGRHEINAWGKSKINLRLEKRKKKSRHSDRSPGCRFVFGPVFAPCSKGSLLGSPSRLGHNGPGYRIHHLKPQFFPREKEVKSSVLKQKFCQGAQSGQIRQGNMKARRLFQAKARVTLLITLLLLRVKV